MRAMMLGMAGGATHSGVPEIPVAVGVAGVTVGGVAGENVGDIVIPGARSGEGRSQLGEHERLENHAAAQKKLSSTSPSTQVTCSNQNKIYVRRERADRKIQERMRHVA